MHYIKRRVSFWDTAQCEVEYESDINPWIIRGPGRGLSGVCNDNVDTTGIFRFLTTCFSGLVSTEKTQCYFD